MEDHDKIPFSKFKEQLREGSLFELNDPSSIKRWDGKWIWNIKKLARCYGIPAEMVNSSDKASLIEGILFKESIQHLFTYQKMYSDQQSEGRKEMSSQIDEAIAGVTYENYSIETNKSQNKFNPYSITIKIGTKDFHDRLLEALYELESYSDKEIEVFVKQLQNRMRNVSEG